MEYTYIPQGTCSKKMIIEINEGLITRVSIEGGCSGNTQGISRLLEGMAPQAAISKIKGIVCKKNAPTSCPDQLARALEQAIRPQL